MAMTVTRRKDSKTPNVFIHKVADIRGGVSINVSELGGDFIREGAVVSAPIEGVCHVVKYAEVYTEAGSSATEIVVKKGHNFKVGDFIMAKVGAKAYAITEINESKNYDTLVVGTTLGVKLAVGAFVIEAKAESSTTTSALKYTPFAVVGTGKPMAQGMNFDTDAWVIGVTKGNPLPSDFKTYLPTIINY